MKKLIFLITFFFTSFDTFALSCSMNGLSIIYVNHPDISFGQYRNNFIRIHDLNAVYNLKNNLNKLDSSQYPIDYKSVYFSNAEYATLLHNLKISLIAEKFPGQDPYRALASMELLRSRISNNSYESISEKASLLLLKQVPRLRSYLGAASALSTALSVYNFNLDFNQGVRAIANSIDPTGIMSDLQFNDTVNELKGKMINSYQANKKVILISSGYASVVSGEAAKYFILNNNTYENNFHKYSGEVVAGGLLSSLFTYNENFALGNDVYFYSIYPTAKEIYSANYISDTFNAFAPYVNDSASKNTITYKDSNNKTISTSGASVLAGKIKNVAELLEDNCIGASGSSLFGPTQFTTNLPTGLLSYSLDGLKNPELAKFIWSFGDGVAETHIGTPYVQHSFASYGKFTVSVAVYDLNNNYINTFIMDTTIDPVFKSTLIPGSTSYTLEIIKVAMKDGEGNVIKDSDGNIKYQTAQVYHHLSAQLNITGPVGSGVESLSVENNNYNSYQIDCGTWSSSIAPNGIYKKCTRETNDPISTVISLGKDVYCGGEGCYPQQLNNISMENIPDLETAPVVYLLKLPWE